MSARGITFLHKWIANSVPKTARPDVISINELTHKLFADAKSVGIRREEIDEEVDSLPSLVPLCISTRDCRSMVLSTSARLKRAQVNAYGSVRASLCRRRISPQAGRET